MSAAQVGCGEFSPLKWERFEYLLRVHARICRGIIERGPYVFMDLYAGPGIYGTEHSPDLVGQLGSPIRAIKILDEEFRSAKIPAWVPLFVDPECGSKLLDNLQRLGLGYVGVYSVSCAEAIGEWLGDRWGDIYCWPARPMGLCFVDPTGYPDWSALERLATSRRFEMMDFLININSTSHKRCRLSPIDPETIRPTQYLAALGKRNVYLWNPHPSDKHKFTLAYCSNGPFPEFRGHGFHRIDSPHGQRLGRLVDFTTDERRKMGPPPGFFPGFGDLS